MDALEFLNIIAPNHDRTSCNDNQLHNGFRSRNGESWHGRCKRCMYLEILRGEPLPEGFDPEQCQG